MPGLAYSGAHRTQSSDKVTLKPWPWKTEQGHFIILSEQGRSPSFLWKPQSIKDVLMYQTGEATASARPLATSLHHQPL